MSGKGGRTRTSGQGRKKGVPNKVTKALKDMILGALSDAGGQAYLLQQAHAEPRAFLALIGRVLPTEITGKDGTPVSTNVVFYLPTNGRDG